MLCQLVSLVYFLGTRALTFVTLNFWVNNIIPATGI